MQFHSTRIKMRKKSIEKTQKEWVAKLKRIYASSFTSKHKIAVELLCAVGLILLTRCLWQRHFGSIIKLLLFFTSSSAIVVALKTFSNSLTCRCCTHREGSCHSVCILLCLVQELNVHILRIYENFRSFSLNSSNFDPEKLIETLDSFRGALRMSDTERSRSQKRILCFLFIYGHCVLKHI